MKTINETAALDATNSYKPDTEHHVYIFKTLLQKVQKRKMICITFTLTCSVIVYKIGHKA